MRKVLVAIAAALLLCSPAFATYFVVMKDGSQYRAKARPVVAKGVASFQLESGQYLRIDANLIDFGQSDQTTKLGGGEVLGVGQTQTAAPKQQAPSIGSEFKIHHLPNPNQPPVTDTTATVAPVTGPLLSNEVLKKFEMAYENVGIYEHKLTATGLHSFRADLTADNEETVFNAISATSFLMVRNAGVPGTEIDEVELFLKMTNGGSAGRFQMNRADAQAIDSKQITREDYFVRKVLF